MTALIVFAGTFIVGFFVGAWRNTHDIAVCRDCLRKLPIESGSEVP